MNNSLIKNRIDRIETVFKKYNEEIFRYLYLRVGNIDVAEDLTSDVFMKFITTNYDSSKSSPRTWLYLLAKGIFINYIRNKSLRKHEDLSSLESLVGEDEEKKIYLNYIIQQMEILDDELKEILILKFVNGLSHKEIARILNCSYSNSKVKLHRAINILKNKINGK